MINLQERAKRVPGLIRWPLILGAIGLTFYWVFTSSGLFRFFAAFQADLLDGQHYIILSGLLTFLCCLIPVLILVHVLAFFFTKRKT